MSKRIRELIWPVLIIFFAKEAPQVFPVYSDFDRLNIIIGVIAYVGSVRYFVKIITEDYPEAKSDREFDTRLESFLLCKDEDGNVKFKERGDVFFWWLFGAGMVAIIFFLDYINLYLMMIGILFFFASYLVYIRKKAFYRQWQEAKY